MVSPLVTPILALSATAGMVSAQAPSIEMDSIAIRARAAGALEADVHPVSGFNTGAFLTGIFVGFIGPFAFEGLGRDVGLPIYIASPLVVGMIPPTAARDMPVAELNPRFAQYGAQYQDIYETAYRSRLSQRRRTTSVVSSYLGAAVGFGGFFFLLMKSLAGS